MAPRQGFSVCTEKELRNSVAALPRMDPYQNRIKTPFNLGFPWSSCTSQSLARGGVGLGGATVRAAAAGKELFHGWQLGDISKLLNISRPKAVQMIRDA